MIVVAFICWNVFCSTESAAPVFTTPVSPGRIIYIHETTPASSSVYKVTAADADGDVLVYSLTSQVPPSPQKFIVNSQTGIISTLALFDVDVVDAVNSYQISIRTTDGVNSVETTLNIEITDDNDNAPVFVNYQVIRQQTKAGMIVADVKAIDIDSGANGQINYKITGGNINNAFGIDNNAGILYTMYELNPDTISMYGLVIEGRDNGDQPKSSTMTMTLTLIAPPGNGFEKANANLLTLFVIVFLHFRFYDTW